MLGVKRLWEDMTSNEKSDSVTGNGKEDDYQHKRKAMVLAEVLLS